MNTQYRILLIGMRFFGYELKIVSAMKRKGYQVDFIYDTDLLLRKILVSSLEKKLQIEKLQIEKYHKIVIIVGRRIGKSILINLQTRKQKDAKLILYLWDDVSYVDNFEENRGFYNTIYSFDPGDCQKYSLMFLPLFYEEDTECDTSKNIDLYCAMTDSRWRLDIMERLEKRITTDITTKLIVNVGKRKYLYSVIKNRKNHIEYRYTMLPKQMDLAYMRRAKCILDINYPTQTGLSTRLFEALKYENKVITTNESVKNYDFYNPNNIQIIDRVQLNIDWSFLNTGYEKLHNDIRKKYCIDTWIEHLLGGQSNDYLVRNNEYGI